MRRMACNKSSWKAANQSEDWGIRRRNEEQIQLGECLVSFGSGSFSFPFAIQKYKYEIYRTLIFLVVLYGCETWSVTMGEEHRLRVFENRLVTKIFGPNREVTRDGRKLHNEELYDMCSSPNIILVIKSRRMTWAVHVTHVGDGIGAYTVLVGRSEWERPLGRPRRRWKDNIKMDLQEVG